MSAGDELKEKELQRVFKAWGASAPPAQLAGVPDWLWDLGKPTTKHKHGAFGYTFEPDVHWARSGKRQSVVAELKYGTKYEPIAVAEALHHAHLLARHDKGRRPVPVVVSQFNGWIRAAVHEVAASGLRHVEVDFLEYEGTEKAICWISDPHAKTEEKRSPPEVPLEAAWRELSWWKVDGEYSWIVSATRPTRPFHEGPMAIVSAMRGAPDRYVLWTGRLPKLHDHWNARDWSKSGTYWVSTGARGPGEMPPPPAAT